MTYSIRVKNCMGWSEAAELLVPISNTPQPICAVWNRPNCPLMWRANCQYECIQQGLTARAMSDTSLFFEWTPYEYAQVTNVDVGLGRSLFYKNNDFASQLMGHNDPNALLGYQLYMDDGMGGSFHLEFDGTQGQRMANTTLVENLFPGRIYRAYVVGVSWAGVGARGELLYFPMVLPPGRPHSLSLDRIDARNVKVSWQGGSVQFEDRLQRVV